MINPLSALSGSAVAGLSVVAMFMYGQWQSAEAEVARIEAHLSAVQAAKEVQDVTIAGMMKNASHGKSQKTYW